jgi:hypothetical protein
MRSIYTAAGALLLATHALFAQAVATAPTTPPAVAAPDWLLDQTKVIAEAKDVTTEKYPDADTVLVSEYQRTEYKADGSFVTLDDQYVKVLTEAGRKDARERAFGFDAAYGGMEILGVDVIKPSGAVTSHDPSQISKEQVSTSSMGANIFDPNEKMVVAALPGVEIGDLVHFYVRSWESKPRMQGNFADMCVL